MRKIDSIDREIVNLLIGDGRMQAIEIARHLDQRISERAVRYRINRLVKDGVIHIGAIANPRALGYQVVADIFVEVESGRIEEVARILADQELVSYVACSIGERDLSVQLLAHDNSEVYSFATSVIGKIPGVRKTTASIVPLVIKDVYQWRIPANLELKLPKLRKTGDDKEKMKKSSML